MTHVEPGSSNDPPVNAGGAPMPLPAPVATPSFAYTAQADDGHRMEGQIEAPDGAAAMYRLQSQLRLHVTELRPARITPAGGAIRGDAFLAFNQQLAQLTKAGLPIEQGLRLIAADLRRGRLARTVATIAGELESGTPLGAAFDKHRSRFPALYGRLVDAGVRSGNLPAVLLNLGRNLELQQRLRAALWRSIAYPLMVMIALLMVIGFLGVSVLPQLEALFTDFHLALPGVTVALLAFGRAAPFIAVGGGALIAAWVLAVVAARTLGREQAALDHLLLPMPLVGPVLRMNLIARWLNAMQIAVQAGLDLPAAIDLAGDAVGSARLRRDGAALSAALANGQPISSARTRLLPATVPATIEFASGHHDLPATLRTLTELYERQAELRLERVPAVLTPLLVIVIAVVIGFVVAGILAPLVQLMQSMMGATTIETIRR